MNYPTTYSDPKFLIKQPKYSRFNIWKKWRNSPFQQLYFNSQTIIPVESYLNLMLATTAILNTIFTPTYTHCLSKSVVCLWFFDKVKIVDRVEVGLRTLEVYFQGSFAINFPFLIFYYCFFFSSGSLQKFKILKKFWKIIQLFLQEYINAQ